MSGLGFRNEIMFFLKPTKFRCKVSCDQQNHTSSYEIYEMTTHVRSTTSLTNTAVTLFLNV